MPETQPDQGDVVQFGAWLRSTQGVLRDDGESAVPCGSCTACCRSSQFVHIRPDEHDTLAHIPAELLFPAPTLPRGHVVMGYDERGHCPMLADTGCSIYEHRPRACRQFDCRVLGATSVELVEPSKRDLAERARRWHFETNTSAEEAARDALKAAAEYLAAAPELLPSGRTALATLQHAALAIEIHELFLDRDSPPARQEVADAVARLTRRPQR